MLNIKKLSISIVLALFTITFIPTISMADAKKGHKLYKKKLQKKCKVPGSIFARKHTQDEWEEIYEDGLFKEETKKLCPLVNIEKIKEKQWQDIYEFIYKHGIGGVALSGCDPK